MRILALGGAGAVCRHATRDLAEFSDFKEIVIGDYNIQKAEKLAADISDPRVNVIKIITVQIKSKAAIAARWRVGSDSWDERERLTNP
jgi:saccharopine dehydrogenase-like NADP-dependent oxidoreductase